MRVFHRWMGAAFVMLAVLVAATGCVSAQPRVATDQPVTSALTEEQAREIADNALQALTRGDYAAYSRDWSETMKASISEADFTAFRDDLLAQAGQYQRITDAELTAAQTPGFVRWAFTAEFENASRRFAFTFPQEGSEVVGVFME